MGLVIAFFILGFQNTASIYFSTGFILKLLLNMHKYIPAIHIHLKEQQFNCSGHERL